MACIDCEPAIIEQGSGITVSGSGTPSDPYIVSTTFANLNQFIRVQDSPSVDLQLTGTGSTSDPLTIRAVSTLKLTDLTDVQDPSGAPAVGESPVWTGVGAAAHWEFKLPPSNPSGSVNVDNGLSGSGAAGDPIEVATSGVWGSGSLSGLGSDSTIGQAIYVDSAGKLRAQPGSSVAWAAITGKPSYFPVDPSTTWSASNITNQNLLNAGKVNGIKISSTDTSVTPPSSPTHGDLWFFPKGA